MNETLTKIHELLESSDKTDKKIGKQMLEQYRKNLVINTDSLVEGATYDLTIVSWNNGAGKNPCAHIKTRTMAPFGGADETSGLKRPVLFFGQKIVFLSDVLSISPTEEGIHEEA
jgi:hypothetical protein